ncbi:PIN domain-containing protein [Streptomyces sp. B1-3]|uniref:PIN domain-containing protein n=1 Tax=Streptomyces sp. B1-3 TaxID=3141453 RepID=UPI003D26560C
MTFRPGAIVMADTCALFAAVDETDPVHDQAAQILNQAGLLVISPLVLAELDHLCKKEMGDWEDRLDVADMIERQVTARRAVVPELTSRHLRDVQELRRHYGGLQLDMADATVMVLAADYPTIDVLTIDERDFRRVKPPRQREPCFRLLPADA